MRSRILIVAAAFVGASAFGQAPAAPATTGGQFKTDAKAIKAQGEADYNAAKEACHAKKGPDRKWCLREAEAAHDKAEAEARTRGKQ